jgi:hypothetical protein
MNGTPGNPIANDGFLWTMMDVPVRKVLATEGKCHGKFPWNHETNPWNQQCIISIAPICIIMYQYITNMYHLSSVYIYMVYMVYMVYIYVSPTNIHQWLSPMYHQWEDLRKQVRPRRAVCARGPKHQRHPARPFGAFGVFLFVADNTPFNVDICNMVCYMW